MEKPEIQSKQRHFLNIYSELGKVYVENGFHKDLSLTEQISKKLIPLLEKISSLFVKTKGDDEEYTTQISNTAKENSSGEEFEDDDYSPDMRCVLGYLNQCDSV